LMAMAPLKLSSLASQLPQGTVVFTQLWVHTIL
jgi:hypothetical protein